MFNIDRKNNLARRLTLWSIMDQIDSKLLEKEVSSFICSCSEQLEEVLEIQKQILELKLKQKNIAKDMIDSCVENIKNLQAQTKSNLSKPLVDLAFWSKISDLNPDLYNIIYPCLEEIGDEKTKKNKKLP